MRRMFFIIVLLISANAYAADPPYHLIKEIPIGGSGGWDDISVDAAAHRLYVTHGARVIVVDVDAGKVVGEITDTPGVHGFAIAADLGRGFTSNGRANTSTIIDLKTLKPLGTVQTGANPDEIVYEPTRREVYAFNGNGMSATVFDATTGMVRATITLGGKPEGAVEDVGTNRIFVNLEDTGTVAVIDAVKHVLVTAWRLVGCDEPTGLAFDPRTHRLFSVCSNKVMIVTDSVSGAHVTSIPIGERAGDAAFDAETNYAFSSNGEGTLTIAHLDSPSKLTVVQTLTTEPSARTMVLDPVTHNLYLPAATMTIGENGRTQQVPNTFRVLMYGMDVPVKRPHAPASSRQGGRRPSRRAPGKAPVTSGR